MKRAFLLIVLGFAAASLLAVDSVRLTESYNETLAGSAPDYEKVGADVVSVTATVTLPGLSEEEVDDNTDMGCDLRSEDGTRIGFLSTPLWASQKTDNSWTYIFNDEDIDTGKITELERVVFKRQGDVLQLTWTLNDTRATFATEEQLGQAGTFRGQLNFILTFGFLDNREISVFYSGNTRLTSKTVGSGADQETFDLASVQISGTADFTPPTVSVTKPTRNFRTTNDLITVNVQANDNVGIDWVGVRSDSEMDFTEAVKVNGVANTWTAMVTLVPGTNIIYASCRDLAGNESFAEQKVVYVVLTPIGLAVEPAAGGTIMGLTNGQPLEIARRYTVTAKPATGYVFGGWTGGMESSSAVLAFDMEAGLALKANFVLNPFKPFAGTFNGLFVPEEEPDLAGPPADGVSVVSSVHSTELSGNARITPTNSGFITLALTDNGLASGKLMLAGQTYSYSGVQFSGYGKAITSVRRSAPLAPLALNLELDLENANGLLTGRVIDGNWESPLKAFLVKGSTHFVASYTFLIPGGEHLKPLDSAGEAEIPGGDGAGTISISAKGIVTLSGSLGDGTSISCSSGLSGEGLWPIYVPLQQGKGVLLGWGYLLRNASYPDHIIVDGPLRWVKTPVPSWQDKFYPNGFSVNAFLTGSRYQAPLQGQPLWNWANGVFALAGGNLGAPIQNPVEILTNKLVILNNNNRIALTITSASGLVSGSFMHPNLKKTVTLKGALIQWPDVGYQAGGWFLGTNQSGYLFLGASP